MGRGCRRPKDEERHKILIGEETNGALSQLWVILLQRLMRRVKTVVL